MFATAAIVDAVRKDDRRRELDRQLDEARRELSELQDRRAADDQESAVRPAKLTIRQMDALWSSLKTIYNERPFMKEIDKPATASISDLLSSLQSDYYGCCPEEALMRTARRTRADYERLERAILDEESDTSITSRDSRTRQHLLMESVKVEHLVQQLLHRAELLDRCTSPSPSFEEAREMARKGTADFTFRSIDPVRARKGTSLLNRELRCLMDEPKLGLKEKIGRVCYNLLVSSHAPDIHTYNTLIVAFNKVGQHGLADALVNSFFRERLLRPTPSTYAAVLDHHRVTRNHGGFLRTLACLTGIDGQTGAKFRRRHVNDVATSEALGRWAADTRMRTRTGDWVWEHMPLSRPLVEDILGGLLFFRLFDQAASFLLACLRSGVDVGSAVASHVLDDCVAALDWRAALRLVRGFTDGKVRWESMLSTDDDVANSRIILRLRTLLDLCGLHGPGRGRPSKACLANLKIEGPKLDQLLRRLGKHELPTAFGWFADAAAGPPTSEEQTGVAGAKSRLLRLESAWREYVVVRKTTISIESKLLQAEFSTTFRRAMALHVGTTAVERAAELGREFGDTLSALTCPTMDRRGTGMGAQEAPDGEDAELDALSYEPASGGRLEDAHSTSTDLGAGADEPAGPSTKTAAAEVSAHAAMPTRRAATTMQGPATATGTGRELRTWPDAERRTAFTDRWQWAG
ncbi:hypothetical protein DCS_02380 [Drechmeria coniospora]|uniref:Pentatricopeptide repeat domain-containing protein n=1 Tax=Drechmeria coniospora TaxID=98403 RepID=A0A151GVW1_DRECN|nr:hypothetical protein DCS_02380 [Drechmeria coniospora]KYK61238.1 hypothetical protein DCS_02380 [Drechmeria coniospora]